jgi:hypothetical protein
MSHPAAYYEGKEQRKSGLSSAGNPYRAITNHWSWWQAGYNDMDIQLSKGETHVPTNTRPH